MIRPEQFIETKAITGSRTPLLNYVERVTADVDYSDYAQISRKKRLQYLVLRTPELCNMLWDIAEDIVGGVDFIPLNRGNGKRRVMNAKKWSRNVKFRERLHEVVFDILSTGEGYSYLGAKALAMISEVDKVSNPVIKEKMYDEAVVEPLFRSVSSITMTNDHDATNLIKYTQRVYGTETSYALREIVHSYFKRIAGKVEGFTPVSTMNIQLELLWLLWTNQYDLQAKGNMPDMFVVAEDIKTNTPALKDLENKLRKYNMPGSSKHGTTVLYGGKYSFEQMEKDTSLQFADVGKAVTAVVAGAFRYPSQRLGIKTKEGASSKDTQGNGDRDYWNLISKWQDKLTDDYDPQLWEPFFGVQMVFDKSYLHDEVVEGTVMRSRIDNINLINSMLRMQGKQIPMDDTIRFIEGKNINYEVEDVPKEFLDMQMAQTMPLSGTPAKQKDQDLSSRKKQEQSAQENNTGKQKRY